MAAKPNDNCDNRRKALKILGLSENATSDEIRKAYKTLARQCNPDKNSRSETIQKFQELSEAYRFLIEQDGFYNEELSYDSDNSNYFKNLLLIFNVLKDSLIRKRFEISKGSRLEYSSEDDVCSSDSKYHLDYNDPPKDSHRINQPTTGHQPKKKKQGRKQRISSRPEGEEMQQPRQDQQLPEDVSANEVTDEIDDERFYQLLKQQIGNQVLEEEIDLDPDEAVQKYGNYEEWKQAQKIRKKRRMRVPPNLRSLPKKEQGQLKIEKGNQSGATKEKKYEEKTRPRKGKSQKSFQDETKANENASSVSSKLGLFGGSKNASPVSIVKKERQLTFENHMEKVKEAKAQKHRKESEESSSVKSDDNPIPDFHNGQCSGSPSGLNYEELEHAERQLSPRKPYQQKSEKTGKLEILVKQQELERQRNWNERREIQALEAQRRRRSRLYQTKEEHGQVQKGRQQNISTWQEGLSSENSKSLSSQSFPEPERKIQVNVWEQRQSQQKVLHSLEPASVEEEEAMILKALELSMQEEVEQQRQILNLYTKDNYVEGTSCSISPDDSLTKNTQRYSSESVRNTPRYQADLYKRTKTVESRVEHSKPDRFPSSTVVEDWNAEIDGEMYVRSHRYQEPKASEKNYWSRNSLDRSNVSGEPEAPSVLKDPEVPKRYSSTRNHWQNQGARPKKNYGSRNTWNRNKNNSDYFNKKSSKHDFRYNEASVESRCKNNTSSIVNPNKTETKIVKITECELPTKNYYEEEQNSCSYAIPKSEVVANVEQESMFPAVQEISYNHIRMCESNEEFSSQKEDDVVEVKSTPELINVRSATIEDNASFCQPTNHDWNDNFKLNDEDANSLELECKTRTSSVSDSEVVVDEDDVQNIQLTEKDVVDIPAVENVQDDGNWDKASSVESKETIPVLCLSTPVISNVASVENSITSLSEASLAAQDTSDELHQKLVSSPCSSPNIEGESVHSSDISVEKQSHVLSSSSSEVNLDPSKTSDGQQCNDFGNKLEMSLHDISGGAKTEDVPPNFPVPALGGIPFFPAPCFLPGMLPGLINPYMHAMYMQAINAQILGLIHPSMFPPFITAPGFPFPPSFQQSPVHGDSPGNQSRPQSAMGDNHPEAQFPSNVSEEDFNTQTHLEMQRNECSQFDDPNKPYVGVPPCYKPSESVYQIPINPPQQHPAHIHIPIPENNMSGHYIMSNERQLSPYSLQQTEEFQELDYDYSRPSARKEYGDGQFYGGKDGNYWPKNVSQKFPGRYSANYNQENSQRDPELRYQGNPQFSSYHNRHSPSKNWNSMHKNSKAFNRTYFDKNNMNHKTSNRDFQRGSFHSDFKKEGHHFNNRQMMSPDGGYMAAVNHPNSQFELNSSGSFEDSDGFPYRHSFGGCQKLGPQFPQKQHGNKHSKIGNPLLEKRASQEKRWQNNQNF